ncbi:MAG: hypothetical protein AM325_005215 [Candidatus Thorarchaeota archaeon SMTZ1-45]|nr:MAG: hypothetical protein AM325_06980 [Candidatus Thorarchaeota archaeon SMTZ1-45]
MSASFDEPPSDSPRPSQPKPEVKDENIGAIFKIGGSTCLATCTCGLGLAFLIPPLMFAPYGVTPITGAFALIGLFLTVVGFVVGCYGWRVAEEGSRW